MLNFKKINYVTPFLCLFLLFGLLFYELFHAKPNELASARIGDSVPAFKLATVYSPELSFTQADMQGKVSLLNVWATWCYACALETDMLMKIKTQYHIPIYSIAYKDHPLDVKKWLQEKGNPYLLTGLDTNGDTAIDLGVYGTPETFIIDNHGKIIYRHIGVINQSNWDHVLYPLIQQLIQHEKNLS